MVALLRDEPAASRVEPFVASGESVASWINLGETYYQEVRRVGEAQASTAIDMLERQLLVEEPDSRLVMRAAQLKAHNPISYADGFAIATAQRHDLPLLTGDPEIVASGDQVEVIDLREEERGASRG